MLNNIRNFSKTILAKILLVIIIIPFVFWGMGGVFNRGNTNNIVKINNQSVSTQDFMEYINNSRIDSNVIKENIKNNIIEDLLSGLISEKLLELEMKKLNLNMNEKTLAMKIKNNKEFLDDEGKFSRTKYEKFLISRNFSAVDFESVIKKHELKKQLFSYVNGGVKSPFFLTNNLFNVMNSKLVIDYTNLENNYKKKDFSSSEINSFIKKNEDKLTNEYIDFSYAKIFPKDLTGNEEFNELFFKKIDEIENDILNEKSFNDLIKDLKIKTINKANYISQDSENEIEKRIYNKRNDSKIQLIEENEFFVLYEIKKINKILPSTDDKNFIVKVNDMLYQKNKFDFNNKLIEEISNNNFNDSDFFKIANDDVKEIKLNSIDDNSKFTLNSVKLLYDRPLNSYSLVTDEDQNIYLVKIKKILNMDIDNSSEDFTKYYDENNIIIKNTINASYDFLLNSEYKIKINQKTLDRVKNYFE